MKRKQFILFLFVFITIFSTQFFHCIRWKQITGGIDIYYYAIYPIIVLLAIPEIKKIGRRTYYSSFIKAIFGVTFLCIITIFVKGSPLAIDMELPPMLFSMTILTYYLLVGYKVDRKSILKCIISVGFFIFLIQIVQQLNPSMASFGLNDPEKATYSSDVADVRNGLYRFLLPTVQLSLFCMFYYWTRLLEKRNFVTISLFIVFVVSTYLYLTRQIIFPAILVLAITPFMMGTYKRNTRALTFLLIIILIIAAPAILGELIADTKEGGVSTDNRMLSYVFFGEKIIESPLTFLFGSGTPPESDSWHELELNASDIGIVGVVFHNGIFTLIIYLLLLYKLLIKNRDYTPLYVKQYTLCTFICCLLSFPYVQAYEYFLWAIILYLSENREIIDKLQQKRSLVPPQNSIKEPV